MPFAYYRRLSPRRQRIYRRSDEAPLIRVPDAASLEPLIPPLAEALRGEDRARVERLCQRLVDGVTTRLRVPAATVIVHSVRPSDGSGELQGLYEPAEDGRRARLSVWMRTAKRRQVVAFKTFVRTLLHELCHHLDYELLNLPETFHTAGFYQRESSLLRQLLPAPERDPESPDPAQ